MERVESNDKETSYAVARDIVKRGRVGLYRGYTQALIKQVQEKTARYGQANSGQWYNRYYGAPRFSPRIVMKMFAGGLGAFAPPQTRSKKIPEVKFVYQVDYRNVMDNLVKLG